MATKELVDRAMRAFEAADRMGKSLTARVWGVRAAEGMDGMREAFTHGDDFEVRIAAEELEAENRDAGRQEPAPKGTE
jgi:hypothetical protein